MGNVYEVTRGDKYKHYKGGIYTTTGMATHTETNEGLVIYKDDKDCIWARPMEMFFGYLNDGTKRFTLMDEEE
jgi:hypothetical protein